MDKLEGYSVYRWERNGKATRYRIYKDEVYMACISQRWDGKLGWDWHDKSMWSFHTHDFVTIH